MSHLADARNRAGDEPGLTDSFRYLRSENEVSAIGIGAYFVLHRFFNEVSNAVLGPLPLISTSEVETIHPLLGAVRPTRRPRGDAASKLHHAMAYPATRSEWTSDRTHQLGGT